MNPITDRVKDILAKLHARGMKVVAYNVMDGIDLDTKCPHCHYQTEIDFDDDRFPYLHNCEATRGR